MTVGRPPGMVPEGGLVAWDKSMSNTPPLPQQYIECNGQTISNKQSVYDGVIAPNLNGASGKLQRFLKGSPSVAISEGGNDTHTHPQAQCQVNEPPYNNIAYIGCIFASSYKIDANFLPPYIEMVYIMAIIPAVVPVGGCLFYLKSLANTPPLPDEFVECNGQTLTDTQSIYNSGVMRSINGSTEATKLFIRGSSTSGTTGGALTHTHIRGAHVNCYATGLDESIICPTYLVSTDNHLPQFEEVVYVVRVK